METEKAFSVYCRVAASLPLYVFCWLKLFNFIMRYDEFVKCGTSVVQTFDF